MSFLSISPTDIAGFVAASDQMRAGAGSPASFGVPQLPTWPPGTAINPDTNRPFDSTAVQSNQEYVYTQVTVLVIEKEGSPLRPQADQGAYGPSGMREGIDIILDVATADWQATVAQATVFHLAGIDYLKIEEKPFLLGGTTYRYLVYGQAR